jgi:hypothetical protein
MGDTAGKAAEQCQCRQYGEGRKEWHQCNADNFTDRGEDHQRKWIGEAGEPANRKGAGH